MKKQYLLPLFILLTACLTAQANNKNTFYPSHPVAFKADAKLIANPLFQMAPNADLRRVYTHQSSSGREHVKYHQYQDGLRVLGGTVVFHLENNLLTSATGRLAEVKHTEKDFGLTEYQAEQLAYLRLGQELRLKNGLRVENTSRAFANAAYPRSGGATVAVYIVHLKADSGPEDLPVDTEVIVNATTGRILASLSNIHTETVTGHGDGFYHQDITFPVDSLAANEFELRDESRGEGIFAFDITNGLRAPSDEDNEWTPEFEGHQAMIDGYYASVKFYDFLQDRFNRNSIDDEGFPLVANMNQHTFVNAYWNGSVTTYGNGNCNDYSPLTTFTIVGHEYAHGLTEFTSGLIYQDESGALNESISDIFGKALQFYYDNDHFDWRIGSDIRRNNGVRYFRDMANPSLRNHPKLYKGENWRTGAGDAGGVHSNSGVFNFWFYLLVEGKRAGNEAGVFYDVNPIGMDSALQLVYLLETAYLTESSGYEDCHDFSLLAAADLFGAESETYTSVVEAWKAVGLPVVPDTGGGDVELNVRTVIVNTSNFTDFRYCQDELTSILYTIQGLPDTSVIPYGSVLNGQLVFSYFTGTEVVKDTVFFTDLILNSNNLNMQGELELNFSYQIADGVTIAEIAGVTFLTLDGDFRITNLEERMYTFRTDNLLFINGLTAPDLTFRFDQFGPACEEPSFDFDFYSIDFPRCGGPALGLVRMVFTKGTEEVVFERQLEESDGSYLGISADSDVDLSPLGSLNGISYSITYIDGGEEFLILEDNYSKHFANVVDEETIYEFVDLSSAEIDLGIAFCPACPRDFTSEKVNLRDSTFVGNIEDCIPFGEFLGSRLGDNETGPSSISMCVDATNIDEPHLVFKLNQEDSDDFNTTENQYLHMVDVYDDNGSILSEPITGTGGNDLVVEIPLPQDFEGTLTIHVISDGVTTTIHDLGVTAGAPSPTRHLEAGDYGFSYMNPIADQLEVRTSKAVPTGTRVTIMNTAGQVVGKGTIQGLRYEMNTEPLPAGLYFLTISDGSTFSWTGKIVRRK